MTATTPSHQATAAATESRPRAELIVIGYTHENHASMSVHDYNSLHEPFPGALEEAERSGLPTYALTSIFWGFSTATVREYIQGVTWKLQPAQGKSGLAEFFRLSPGDWKGNGQTAQLSAHTRDTLHNWPHFAAELARIKVLAKHHGHHMTGLPIPTSASIHDYDARQER